MIPRYLFCTKHLNLPPLVLHHAIWFVFCWVAKSAFGTTPHFWAAKNWVPQWHFSEKQVLERWFSASHLRFSVPFWISIVANLDLTNGSTVRVHLRFVRRKYQDGVLSRSQPFRCHLTKAVDFHRGVFPLEQGVIFSRQKHPLHNLSLQPSNGFSWDSASKDASPVEVPLHQHEAPW